MAVVLSPGTYRDSALAVVFSAGIVLSVLAAGLLLRASRRTSSEAEAPFSLSSDINSRDEASAADRDAQNREVSQIRRLQLVHAVCSFAIFTLMVAGKLSLHWTQPWVYIVVLYLASYLPASATDLLRWAGTDDGLRIGRVQPVSGWCISRVATVHFCRTLLPLDEPLLSNHRTSSSTFKES